MLPLIGQDIMLSAKDVCVVCRKVDSHCKLLQFNLVIGWFYCDECFETGLLKKHIVKEIQASSMIPCHMLADKKKLFFFRESTQSVQEARVVSISKAHAGFLCLDQNSNFGILLGFNHVKDKGCDFRWVLLENIFKHTESLYEEFIQCDNLFEHSKLNISKLKIGFADLGPIIQDKIRALKK